MNEQRFMQLIADLRQRIPSLDDPAISGDDSKLHVRFGAFEARFGKLFVTAMEHEKYVYVTYTGNTKPVSICVLDVDAGMDRICEFINKFVITGV